MWISVVVVAAAAATTTNTTTTTTTTNSSGGGNSSNISKILMLRLLLKENKGKTTQLTGQPNDHDTETNTHEVTAKTYADIETLLI